MNLPLFRPSVRSLFALIVFGISFFAGPAQAASTATGTIEGRVLNTTNGAYLNNARVTVEGTNVQAFTNEFGEYRLNAVPSGAATVRVFYTGLPPQTATVNVPAGQTVTNNV